MARIKSPRVERMLKKTRLLTNRNEQYEYWPQCRVGEEESEGWLVHLGWSANGFESERQS